MTKLRIDYEVRSKPGCNLVGCSACPPITVYVWAGHDSFSLCPAGVALFFEIDPELPITLEIDTHENSTGIEFYFQDAGDGEGAFDVMFERHPGQRQHTDACIPAEGLTEGYYFITVLQ